MRSNGFPILIRSKADGFTLSELLIALVILGVIATFTIPKVLQSQSSSKNTAIAKEVAAMYSEAYQAYKSQNTASGSTTVGDLTPYLNYVKRDTTTLIDDIPTLADYQCDNGAGICLALHNGAISFVRPWISFGNTAVTNAIYVSVDPDGKASSLDAVNFMIYFNGRVTSEGACLPNTISSDGTRNPNAAADPSWFSWN